MLLFSTINSFTFMKKNHRFVRCSIATLISLSSFKTIYSTWKKKESNKYWKPRETQAEEVTWISKFLRDQTELGYKILTTGLQKISC